jgi:hypothetical protein
MKKCLVGGRSLQQDSNHQSLLHRSQVLIWDALMERGAAGLELTRLTWTAVVEEDGLEPDPGRTKCWEVLANGGGLLPTFGPAILARWRNGTGRSLAVGKGLARVLSGR